MSVRRIAVVSPEPIRPKMAGMGIRALEIAKSLAGEFDVRLLTPSDGSEAVSSGGLTVVAAAPGSEAFGRETKGADAALVSGHAANHFFFSAPDVPVAVDFYDPYLVENFRYRQALGPGVEDNDRRAWNLAIARGDFFLCASEEQRLFYAGALLQAGRVDGSVCADDPELSRLLRVVPFGAEPPRSSDSATVRRQISAGPADPVLWFGGLYDWNDVDPLFAIWPELLTRFPAIRLLFAENPNSESTPQGVYARAVATATERGWLSRSIFFLPWVPYARRGDLYAAATLAVSSSRPGLEADLSFRTRLLDAAAAGVPVVTLHGGCVGRSLEEAGGGRSVASARELFEAIERWLREPEERREAGERARRFSADFSWARVTEPLAEFFRAPRLSRRLAFPEAEPRGFRRLLAKWSR